MRSRSFPLGATVYPDGVNFCIFSKNCDAVELLIFDQADAPYPAETVRLDPEENRTFYYWHIFLPGIKAGQVYAYRVHGPFQPEKGLRFDGSKVLLDPYAKAVVGREWYSREAASSPGDNCPRSLRAVVIDPGDYDWEDDTQLGLPFVRSTIYEMHVGGFTRHPSSGVEPELRGTYAGLIEKIPYLKSLGINAVELLPIQFFDEQDAPPPNTNYWGYSPIAFFAPHSGYSARQDPLGPVDEFRDMVKALHQAGIEVILDVVFNHTAETDESGPTLSFRGLENRTYYHLEKNGSRYANYSGTGNSINASRSIVRQLIMDCLRYWVCDMHVDGFRFDLASVLARGEAGQPLKNPPLLWEIESDPVLAGAKIIAEAWDAAGLYQVGSFIGHRWAEWNGQFRDDVRRFVKGDDGTVTRLSHRITGSPDLYPKPDREPNRSINFVTSHDGFTINDLVSYNRKHNYDNGENNRDGSDHNFSWNCGREGATDNPHIEKLRQQQIKNFMTILLLSQGTPMLLMGDELRRSQQGNNNAYCQDNEISWLDWTSTLEQADLLRFIRGLIDFSAHRPIFCQERFWTAVGAGDGPPDNGQPHISWHGVRLGKPDWGYFSHSLAFTLGDPGNSDYIHVILNAFTDSLNFELPPLPANQNWHRIVDTSLASPDDYVQPDDASPVEADPRQDDGCCYRAASHSVAVLLAR